MSNISIVLTVSRKTKYIFVVFQLKLYFNFITNLISS